MSKRPFQRLPSSPSPVHYDLTYTRVSLVTCDFEGVVQIQLDFHGEGGETEDTVIVVNALDLCIQFAKLSDGREAAKFTVFPQDQLIEFHFAGSTPQTSRLVLEIGFQGKLNDLLAGFYRSKLNGDEYMACTQFEATDARRAFPCWDEPARKATFQLKLVLPREYFALSNTRVQSKTSQGSNHQVLHYYPTPKMSTYLLAWVIAPNFDQFDSLSQISSVPPHVETVVYVAKGKIQQAKFASKVGLAAIDFFTKLFDLPYPLPVLAHIAIPDFAAGAMENWGLVTYREARLLVDEAKISSNAKRDVARVVAHETAHMWFGNSTTMEWWTDLWLNEGFARFCEYLCVDHVLPEMDVFTSFAVDVVGTALKLDSLKSTHAVRVEVSHPKEISEIFDTVSYAKGGSLLQMCVHLLGGMDKWTWGVQRYLKQFQYCNAVSSDLWNALEPEMPGITRIMTEWTDQVGYPVIYVDREGKLTQERYLTIPQQQEDAIAKWTVPLWIISPEESNGRLVISTPTHKTSNVGEDVGLHVVVGQWFVLNGYADLFRVRYTDEQFRAICTTGFASGRIPVRAALAVVRDLFDFAESGHLDLGLALELALEIVPQERNSTVLLVLLAKLQTVVSLCAEKQPRLCELVCQALIPVLNALGPWELADFEYFTANDEKLDELRVVVLRLAADCGWKGNDIALHALELTARHCRLEKSCPNDLRQCVFRLAVGAGALDMLLDRFPKVDSQEQREILASFSGLKTKPAVQQALTFLVEHVRTQDVPSGIAALCAASSASAAEVVWEDFQANFAVKWDKFASGGFFLWSNIVSSIAVNLPNSQRAGEVREFFNAVEQAGKLGSAQRSLDQALEKVAARDEQMARYKTELIRFLDRTLA
ncbi:hypothetical protein BASA81_010039 [Batrachochytrium salamandrivorans]|nr:hypothetical protein BASA81_010039 [Batrachochytrium salamandrivorans]